MILLYIKKNNYNQNTDEGSNNLSTTSINNCKTSENNVIRTTETPNNNDVINYNFAAPTWKEKFWTNTASFTLGSNETELIKEKVPLQYFANLIHLLVVVVNNR